MSSPGPQVPSGGTSGGGGTVTGNPGNFTVRGVHITSSGKRPKAAGFTPSGPTAKSVKPTTPTVRKPVAKPATSKGK